MYCTAVVISFLEAVTAADVGAIKVSELSVFPV